MKSSVPFYSNATSLLPVVKAKINSEIKRLGKKPGNLLDDPSLRWDDLRLSIDSLQMMQLAGAINDYFCLFEVGIEDFLLAKTTLGEWVELIAKAYELGCAHIRLQSSGTSGQQKIIQHAIVDLEQESAHWAQSFNQAQRLLCFTPIHHIYGLLFGAMLSHKLGCPLYTEQKAFAMLHQGLSEGDILVGFPDFWHYFLQSGIRVPKGIRAVTSTAPMAAEQRNALLALGLEVLFDVYGSTETGGIGFRTTPQNHYALLPYFMPGKSQNNQLWRQHLDGRQSLITAPDYLLWQDERLFSIEGRIDSALQVGGVNVNPKQIADAIAQIPNVNTVVVRSFTQAQVIRLKAFVVLDKDTPKARQSLLRLLEERFVGAERLVQVNFGAAIPTNEMGKPCDWPVD
jgi:4-coumarate--CoA ligase (photoactive yellow protein activation family)